MRKASSSGGGAGLLERATGVGVGQDDDLAGVHDLGGFRHEVDAAEDDDIGVGGLGLIGEAERVADVVGDILDVAGLIVVGEDDGVAFFLEGEDFLLEIEGAAGMACGGWSGFGTGGFGSRLR